MYLTETTGLIYFDDTDDRSYSMRMLKITQKQTKRNMQTADALFILGMTRHFATILTNVESWGDKISITKSYAARNKLDWISIAPDPATAEVQIG